ncbi:hypothetical protein [Mycobacterium sp.]|uniref:hypothetical protein n=1 Tax=Mycobacterium sp. TaxID=1785 RepID=UPI002D4329B1|nr:hypothetical protein [Mycobacterium sp.]HZA09082.1 hypothetical protein [Mycobacterium sp.]
MNLTKIAGTATIAGALGAAALGLGAGTAQADDWVPWVPWVPHVDNPVDWNPLPPGQAKKLCPVDIPPGQWLGGPHGMACVPEP